MDGDSNREKLIHPRTNKHKNDTKIKTTVTKSKANKKEISKTKKDH
jgi:hypothetical protein